MDDMNVKSIISMRDVFLFNNGENTMSYNLLGAFCHVDGGVFFSVWAPRAKSVSVVGDFNDWDPSIHFMTKIDQTGIWSAWIKEAQAGQNYQFAILSSKDRMVFRADPYARYAQLKPERASIIWDEPPFEWADASFLKNRPHARANNYPLNIYEIHLGSWKHHEDGSLYTYLELAEELPAYCKEMGYTHVEFLPITEYPFDGSWGYQVTGYFSPTSRYGNPHEFKVLVNALHVAGIGVLLDWVPAHFPKDEFALAAFDGTPTFEPADPRMAHQQQWDTLVFDYGKSEVRSFLFSSAMFWIENYHIDGIRVDAVPVILYRNYGSAEYVPNQYGGRENIEGIAFLKELTQQISQRHPQVLLMAEEATTYPKITHKEEDGGVGFNYKWDMGWMHDTLEYFSTDYCFRSDIHNKLTFSMSYAFSERFIMPLSHDEVVHGKCSLINKMPGDYWRKFANLRVLMLYMIAHPGAKLTFMGAEIAQFIEWRYYEGIEWFLLEYEMHAKYHAYIKCINHLYLDTPAFWERDTDWEGFKWINANDSYHAVYLYQRSSLAGETYVIVMNLKPVPITNYTFGVPCPGSYTCVLNSDDVEWGGSGYPITQWENDKKVKQTKNSQVFKTQDQDKDGLPQSLSLDLPPLAVVVLKWNKNKEMG